MRSGFVAVAGAALLFITTGCGTDPAAVRQVSGTLVFGTHLNGPRECSLGANDTDEAVNGSDPEIVAAGGRWRWAANIGGHYDFDVYCYFPKEKELLVGHARGIYIDPGERTPAVVITMSSE